MKRQWHSRSGVFAAGFVLSAWASGAMSQPAGAPPTRDHVPQFKAVERNIAPGVRFDATTGISSEYVSGIPAVHIPFGGVLPPGTIPPSGRQPPEPRGGEDQPWAPDGTGHSPPLMDDHPGPASQPLMKDLEGPGPNGLTPPDPDMARGYDYEVCATNDDFGVYDSCGKQVFTSDINSFLGINDFLYDPKVIFDPWAARWVMMYHSQSSSPQTSHLVFVVSANSLPFGVAGSGSWYYYVDVQQDAGTGNAAWADYFDLGYSNSEISTSGNMFFFNNSFRWARIMVWDKNAMYSASGLGYWNWWNLTNPDGSQTNTPRAAKMQTSWSEGGYNIDAYFVNSRWGGGNKITTWKVRSIFVNNFLNNADTAVGNYTLPPAAVQPNGAQLDTIDCRLMPAVITNDFQNGNGIELFTSLNAASGSDCRTLLYKFDAVSTAEEFESLFGSTGFDYWFGSPAADYSGSNFWVFSRTANSSGNEASIRFVDTNRGVFSSSSALLKAGTGSYGGFRWGDYFGGQMDWGDYSANGGATGAQKVWLYAEYAKPNDWGTHAGATSVFPQGSISNVTPSTTFSVSGPQGGPFSPSSRAYTLQSAAGDTGVAYNVTGLPSWLDVSSAYGQIWTDTGVTLSVNSAANGLGAGTYNATVFFTDCFNGGNSFARAVQLVVQSTCFADFNHDGVVDTRDVIAFLNAWNTGSRTADCDNNGTIDTRDVICFLNLWNNGC